MRALRIICLSGVLATSRPAPFLAVWLRCELFHAIGALRGWNNDVD